VQRRFQKVVEVAPAPSLDPLLRERIVEAALRFARTIGYRNLGTFEFLVDVSGRANAESFVFIEANARLQVEHTVTEVITGVDLVQTQLRLAQGATLRELGLDRSIPPRGYAIQARVNMETIRPDGMVRPGGGTLDEQHRQDAQGHQPVQQPLQRGEAAGCGGRGLAPGAAGWAG
jgi:pyruvate carboxylase